MQQGEEQLGEHCEPQELAEFFGFAETLRLAVFATDSLTSEAVVVRGSEALAELIGRAKSEIGALSVAELMGPCSVRLASRDLADAELRHASGHGVPVFLTVRQLGGEVERWIWLVFGREPARRSVVVLAQQLVHEVSNPLTSVVCRLDLVARQLPRLVSDHERSEDLGRHLATAQHGAERVITLVREFADSLERAPDISAPVDVVAALSNALALLEPDLEQVATLVRDFQVVPPVLGHASKLEQVFSNLLQNALHAVKEASVPQDHRVRVSVSSQSEWVVVGVEDTGVGMPESLARRVFEPFVTTRAASGGTGLGLFICREVVESLGGRLDVKSSPLAGSRFEVWLRAVDDARPSSTLSRGAHAWLQTGHGARSGPGELPPRSHRRSKRA